jgi:hypothetical protein
MSAPARISAADILRAKTAAEEAGLRLVGLEKRPDGSIKLEFGEPQAFNDDWRVGTAFERHA